MPQEHEQEYPATDAPQFEPSPEPNAADDQPATPPPAAAPTSPGGPTAAHPPEPSLKAQQAAPAKQSTVSIMSTVTMSVATAALAIGAYALYRDFAPPRPPGEVTNAPDDMAKKDDLKKLTDRVDQLGNDMEQNRKQIETRPDFAPQLKMQGDRLNELNQSVTQMTPQFDSINQKLATLGQVQGSNSPARLDGMEKRVGELNKTLDSLRDEVATLRGSGGGRAAAGSTRLDDVNVEGAAMEQAVDLFKARKYAEARDAFVKLQSVFPNDARVWYYSALANGFASGEWLGDTERMVNTGLDKEKAGQPSSAKVDAIFADLTTATGKDWLAGYRKRITPSQ